MRIYTNVKVFELEESLVSMSSNEPSMIAARASWQILIMFFEA